MPGSGVPRGDSHNFGRRVEIVGQRVVKPRTLVWEELLLSATSPLRKALAVAARDSELGPEAFEFLPSLRFWNASAQAGGAVERIALVPLEVGSAARRGELAGVLGRALALFSWLGLPDLHWENLVLGLGAQGRIVFGPLDVEMIFSDFRLPTETKLLPDADPEYAAICRHAAGARRVLPFLGKPIRAADLLTVLAQYRAALQLLEASGDALAAPLLALPELEQAPIRVCLRGTGDYVQAATQKPWPPLLEAEAAQMARGDIPYFFRLYGRPGIHFYETPDLSKFGTLPRGRDMPASEPLLDLERGLRSPARKKLREDGLFAVVAAFDHPSLNGKHEANGWQLSLSPRKLKLRLPGGDELETHRDLSAFVGSLYLPCRCGEVEEPLVPARTVCRPVKASV